MCTREIWLTNRFSTHTNAYIQIQLPQQQQQKEKFGVNVIGKMPHLIC